MQYWEPDFLQTSPLFEPIISTGRSLEKLIDWPDLKDLENLIGRADNHVVTRSGKLVRFVPQGTSVDEFTQQYEPRIYLTGEVQTRTQNWHDLFNALVWVTFPRAKAILNQLHYQAQLQERQAQETRRGPLRDIATLFDESGVVVVSSDVRLTQLLKNFEWKTLFWEHRSALLSQMKFIVFGHGLYEKALNPYLGMTGKGIVLAVDENFFSKPSSLQLTAIDLMLADFISQSLATSADLVPVPVLGYPGWSLDNGVEAYYDNHGYFRSRPILRKK
ncbi:MAG: DUF3025 domain-containing protein [Nitrosomonas sp.]|nr:DUF3025 domain-containing protein [Nitrosomonas sp.]MDP1949831.1 DUF3025 domain-containing protein [Nitrosomonas sp.]